MMSLVNYRLKVTINDGRYLIGQMLAYDKHMNLVLAECEEFRLLRKKPKGQKPCAFHAVCVTRLNRRAGRTLTRDRKKSSGLWAW
jgi:small nuclear ribonucleoprotein (snRNP)-like protein